MRILIVEDEVHLSEALAQILSKNKYMVDVAYDGESGLDDALSGIYDIIILDIMLPKRDGFDLLSTLRGQGIQTPVLLLTAKDEIPDKVRGLDLGADDYLTKPFHTEELLARLRALGRRRGEITEDTLSFADISLNCSTYELSCGEKTVKLGLKEFHIMELLVMHGGHIISKEEILSKVWGYESDADYNNVEVYVSFLRKKLTHIHSTVSIRSLRSVGYFLEVETND